MTREEIIQGLESIESRVIDFPYMTASDWVTIAVLFPMYLGRSLNFDKYEFIFSKECHSNRCLRIK